MSRKNRPSEEDDHIKIKDLMKNKVTVKRQDVKRFEIFKKYSRYLDKTINEGLRNGKMSVKTFEMISEMMREIDNAPTYKDLILFRGDKRSFNVGEIIEDKGFMSKTIDIEVAKRFAGFIDGSVLLLYYPNETKQLYIANYSKFPEEQEMISYPGESFKVIAKNSTGINDYVYAVFDRFLDIILDIDDEIDKQYYEIEKIIPKIEKILQEEYILLELYDEETFLDSEGGLIYYDHDVDFKPSYEHFPEVMVVRDHVDQVVNLITRLYYKGTLKAIHKVIIPKYEIYKIISEGKEKEEDSFYVAYVMVHGLLDSITPKENLPVTEILWKRLEETYEGEIRK